MDSAHRILTARRRFWVVVFAMVSLGVMAGGLVYYRYEQDHIRQKEYLELTAIADLKVRQILYWRQERLDDARRMARDPFLGKAIAAWLRDSGNPGLRAHLLERLKLEQEGEAYGDVLLVAPNSRILLSVRPDPAPLSPAGNQALEMAIAGRQAVLGDFFRCSKDNQVHLDVAAPVLDSQGQPLAVVVLQVNAEKVLYPLIQFWPTPSLTAETLLVEVEGKDILFLNDLRHQEKTALSLREPLTKTELPSVQAALGKQGIFEGRDYRGQEVLADLRPVPQTPWFMVTKVDKTEILAEARYRAQVTFLFVGLFILLAAAVTAYCYRQRQFALFKELYRSERERRQAHEEFRITLYSIGDAVITTDTAGLVKQMNHMAEQLTGWPEAEARGRPLEEVFHILNEETRTTVENPVHRVLREGKVVGLANHTLLIARDGTESPIADSGAPIRDESGAIIGVVLVFRDQTQERAAQKALEESENLYRSLFENMLNGFSYCKMLFEQNQPQDFIFLNVNKSFEELTGLQNVVGRKVSEVIPGLRESDPGLLEIYGRVALTGKPERLEVYVEALKMWFSISVYSPEKEHFVVLFNVITARKQAEEALRQSETKFRELFENMSSAVAIYQEVAGGENFVFLEVNRALERIEQVKREDLLGRKVDEIFPGVKDFGLFDVFQRVWRTGIPEAFPASYYQDQRIRGWKDNYVYRLPAGEVVTVYDDITERKRMEETLQESEEKYRLLVNQIPAVVFHGYGDWSVDFFDDKIESLSGYHKEEFASRRIKWCDLILPEDLDKARQIFIKALKTEKSYIREYRIRRKDGDIRWIQARGQIFCDGMGKMEYVSGVFFDIT
ncbi:MAG: PAS domain S-box protein, partial [Deltaproteobacteria bacterium]|nr:PAS domain S-box protein [Deltaproteobacteria bacterium]